MTQETEKSTLEYQLVQSLLSEQKTMRRWKNTRFFIWVFLFLLTLFILIAPNFSDNTHGSGHADNNYVALIRLNGVIKPGESFSARKVLPELTRAFRDKAAKGVVLLINSPGGSPVQASIIHDKIIQLKKKYHKEVIVVGEDTLASGAYLVATAADKIFVNKDTVTGSIGVIMEGFGFENAMAKIGITRRVFTAGTNKDRLDPFEALKPQDKAKIKSILDAVHQDFVNDVEQGRKGKLNGDPAELFSGDFWTGTQAVKLGLVDGTANIWQATQETFGTTQYRDYSPTPGFWESVMRDVSTELHVRLINHTQLQEKW
ncbi:MAG: S49 family peptidase [Gammaproteobacteria bacterium CG_4_10_14_0_8_um_filter_38_16]|nr:MAG: S49 family peptidase [Gammaproteobacteria bacterium CG_4_10_14_0_8_um_filter_38_16]PJA03167.1 MAG: S49 family peptidase [Gammaproteobacteria bacterium CG_4_10_14_0_2_um_filter_38_22]PJB09959.1 MAG: S49 family peptidase [Gammaproteobacteria bacterium CG_4_9_14_3_um_filter_38_9]